MQEIDSIFRILIIIFSVVIHEVSHGYMAFALGDHTAEREGRLTFNPIKHFDLVGSFIVPVLTLWTPFAFGWAKPVPYNPYNLRDKRWGETKVAFAGPASNLLLAFIFSIIIRLGATGTIVLNGAVMSILLQIVIINLSLAVVNLLPLYPLDGSRIFFSVLPYHLRHIQEFMMRYMFVFLAFFLLFMGDFISYLVIAMFHLFTNL
jgi:Zn-dependent protease